MIEKPVTHSLYIINRLLPIIKADYVYCAVRTEYFNITEVNLTLFYVLLKVHLSIILAINQLNTQNLVL